MGTFNTDPAYCYELVFPICQITYFNTLSSILICMVPTRQEESYVETCVMYDM